MSSFHLLKQNKIFRCQRTTLNYGVAAHKGAFQIFLRHIILRTNIYIKKKIIKIVNSIGTHFCYVVMRIKVNCFLHNKLLRNEHITDKPGSFRSNEKSEFRVKTIQEKTHQFSRVTRFFIISRKKY